MDTHNVHANHIWLPVSARAIGNAPVGSNSSGPVVIPSVSEGGTMVGERSIWGKRSLRALLLVTGGGLWIMWVSTKGVHIGCFQGDERILKRFAVPPCMLEECNMI